MPEPMLDHVSLAVTDLDRSRRFYDAALGALGIEPCSRTGAPRPTSGLSRDAERRDRDALRAAIKAGLDSRTGLPAEQVFAELRARYADRA